MNFVAGFFPLRQSYYQRKTNGQFRLTESGTLLAKACSRFKQVTSTALQLAPALEAVKDAPVPINNEAFVPRDESVSTREKISANNYKRPPVERLFMSETDRQVTNRSIDLERLQKFMAHASEHPEAIEFELGARSIDEGRPAHATTEVGSYTFGGKEIGRDDRELLQEMVPLSATLNLLSRAWDIESDVRGKELN